MQLLTIGLKIYLITFTIFFVLLTENYRLQETYENHLIIKLVSVRLVLPLVSHQTNEYHCNSMN